MRKRKATEKILIVPDTHAPYHDRKAWKVMLRASIAFAPDEIIHIGDLADCYQASTYNKSPERINTLAKELSIVRGCLDDLDALNAKKKVYLEGNHEERLRRLILDKSPALHGMVDLPTALELKARNWQWVPYREDYKLGNIYFTHDTGHAGANATTQGLATYQHSLVAGHTHRMQYIVEGDATGRQILSARFGWLGDASMVDYSHSIKARRYWPLGFGIGYHETKTGLVFISPKPIVNYKCEIEGRIYK